MGGDDKVSIFFSVMLGVGVVLTLINFSYIAYTDQTAQLRFITWVALIAGVLTVSCAIWGLVKLHRYRKAEKQ